MLYILFFCFSFTLLIYSYFHLSRTNTGTIFKSFSFFLFFQILRATLRPNNKENRLIYFECFGFVVLFSFAFEISFWWFENKRTFINLHGEKEICWRINYIDGEWYNMAQIMWFCIFDSILSYGNVFFCFFYHKLYGQICCILWNWHCQSHLTWDLAFQAHWRCVRPGSL